MSVIGFAVGTVDPIENIHEAIQRDPIRLRNEMYGLGNLRAESVEAELLDRVHQIHATTE